MGEKLKPKLIAVVSWEEFERQLHDLQNERLKLTSLTPGRVSPFLFRGHRDSSWELFTTLEREQNALEKVSLTEYYRLICKIRPQIESLTGIHWNMREYPKYEKWAKEWAKEKNISLMLNDLENSTNIDEYSYMIHLRHHGFPSPLLDWTRSHYIAAYFAFVGLEKIPDDKKPDCVSIYLFCELPEVFKIHTFDNPYIHTLGPHIRTHQRHYLQQSHYTICVAYLEDHDEWGYAQHEEGLYRADEDQYILRQFTIPATEWRKVLRLIDAHNINAYSLFGSQESLMETLALREFHLA